MVMKNIGSNVTGNRKKLHPDRKAREILIKPRKKMSIFEPKLGIINVNSRFWQPWGNRLFCLTKLANLVAPGDNDRLYLNWLSLNLIFFNGQCYFFLSLFVDRFY